MVKNQKRIPFTNWPVLKYAAHATAKYLHKLFELSPVGGAKE